MHLGRSGTFLFFQFPVGDETVIKVYHHVIVRKSVLQFFDIAVERGGVFVDHDGGGKSGSFSGDDGWRNHPQYIPCVSGCRGTASGGKDIRRAAAAEGAEWDLIELVAVVKVAYRSDRVIEVPVNIIS